MEPSDRDRLLREIAEIENRLALLNKQKEEAETSLRSLQARLAEGDDQNARHSKDPAPPSGLPGTTLTLTPEDKVTLLLRLFRGRHDVYPSCGRIKRPVKKAIPPPVATNGFAEYVKSQGSSAVSAQTKPSFRSLPQRYWTIFKGAMSLALIPC